MYKCILCKDELFNNYREMLCDNCRRDIASYLRLETIDKKYYKVYVLFFYEGEIKKLVRSFKFHDNTYLAKVFAIYLARAILEEGINCSHISYIPMHLKKKAIRGYDQSELLARETAKITQIPFIRVVDRRVKTRSLYDLNRRERETELKGAFSLITNASNILIIDDIYTTGSTISEVSKTLEESNIENYNFLVLA